jgi:hypothetical protein
MGQIIRPTHVTKPPSWARPNPDHYLSKYIRGAWLFNGDAFDSSGYNNHGTLQGGSSFGMGCFGAGLHLDGTDGDVAFGHLDILNDLREISILCWAQTPLSASAYHAFCDFTGVGDDAFQFIWDNGEDVRFQCYDAGQTYKRGEVTQYATFQGDAFHRAAGVYRRENGTVYAYFDMDQGNTATAGMTGNTGTAASGNTFKIGSRGGSYYWDGIIDHLIIFEYALTTADLRVLYVDPFQMFRRDPLELWSDKEAGEPPAGNDAIMTTNTGWWGPTF